MVSVALRGLRATAHVGVWLVWQSMRISLLEDLDVPQPPGEDLGREAA
jgi:hypothetical protein